MLKIMSKFFLGLVLVGVVMVSTAAAEIEVSGDAYVNISSMYLWRGFDLSNGDPVVQAGTDISFNGFTLGFWGNYDIDTTNLNETNIVLDYTFDAGDLLSVSLGHILYALEDADGILTTGEVYAGVTFNTVLEPNLTLYYDYDEFDGDIFVTASVGHSVAVADNLDLSIGALASYMRSDAYNKLHNAEFSAGLDYALTDQVTLGASGIFSTPISSQAKDAIDDEFMAGLTLTLSF